MSQQDNINTQQQFGEAINEGNLGMFRQLMAADVLDHDPAPDQGLGVEGFVQFFEKFRSAFPDLTADVDHMVCDDDNVAMAYTVTGPARFARI
jgi:predicted ester cyclase